MKKNGSHTIQASVFSNRVILPVFFALITTLLLPATVWYLFTSGNLFDIIGGLVALLLISTIWLVMVWGELRLKAVRLSFTDTHIEVSSFLGLGKRKWYAYEHISGFRYMLQPALPLPYECLILISNKEEVVRISQFYFSNYEALKKIMLERFPDAGMKKFSLKESFTEIFDK